MGIPHLGVPESVLVSIFSWDLMPCFETDLQIVLTCFTLVHDTGLSQRA